MTQAYKSLKLLNVALDFGTSPLSVGRLATREGRVYFEYDSAFLGRALEISPFKLPLKPGLQGFAPDLFDGLPGLFNDSLPDGWGRLLLDRVLRTRNILPGALSPLDRLAHVGNSGMGALTYEPNHSEVAAQEVPSLDHLAAQAQKVLEGDSETAMEELLALNGSSAGARPKAMIGVSTDKTRIVQGVENPGSDYESWLVKFPNSSDGPDAGAVEYAYAQMAKLAGVSMTDSHLFPAKNGAGYFATRRFDRMPGGKRVHVHTACGLLHSDFRVPSLDYKDLIKATMLLTRDIREAQYMFRLAVFNVLAHNRDDHAKNFSYIMDESGKWRMAPAYDLTFSAGPGGEQSTLVMGEGKTPGTEHLIKLSQVADLHEKHAREIIDQTRTALERWEKLASEAGVGKTTIKLVGDRIVSK